MIETSEDLLNIIKAVCLIGFTIFACLGLYYFAMIFRQLFKIIKEGRDRINQIDELIKKFKDRLSHHASYISLLGEGVKKVATIVKETLEKESKKRKKTSSKSNKSAS